MFRLLEEAKLLPTDLVPLQRAANTYTSTGLDMTGFDGVAAVLYTGDIAATVTVDAKIQESDDNSSWSDIAGAAITQLGATDDNKVPSIDLRMGGRANRKKYLRFSVTTANGNSTWGCLFIGYNPAQTPQTQTVAAKFV